MIIVILFPFSPLFNHIEEVRNKLFIDSINPFIKYKEIYDFEFNILIVIVDPPLRRKTSDDIVLIIETIIDISNCE